VGNCCSRLSKVVDFDTSRKRVCNFLLVINSVFSLILPCFRDITSFLLKQPTPPLFHGLFPLDSIADVWATRSEGSKLIIRSTPTYELNHQPYREINGQTDRRTDNIRWQHRALHYAHRAVKIMSNEECKFAHIQTAVTVLLLRITSLAQQNLDRYLLLLLLLLRTRQ